jgi:hypothetical protein
MMLSLSGKTLRYTAYDAESVDLMFEFPPASGIGLPHGENGQRATGKEQGRGVLHP